MTICCCVCTKLLWCGCDVVNIVLTAADVDDGATVAVAVAVTGS